MLEVRDPDGIHSFRPSFSLLHLVKGHKVCICDGGTRQCRAEPCFDLGVCLEMKLRQVPKIFIYQIYAQHAISIIYIFFTSFSLFWYFIEYNYI